MNGFFFLQKAFLFVFTVTDEVSQPLIQEYCESIALSVVMHADEFEQDWECSATPAALRG